MGLSAISKGWLNTILNQEWETNAMQFYAGDLYEIIPATITNLVPRSKLMGECVALNDSYFNIKKHD